MNIITATDYKKFSFSFARSSSFTAQLCMEMRQSFILIIEPLNIYMATVLPKHENVNQITNDLNYNLWYVLNMNRAGRERRLGFKFEFID